MTTTPETQKNGKNGKAQKPRNRASVACTQCRVRRTKCVVGEGQSECDQCRRTETECVLRVNDERKRPTSKAYTSSLSQRIQLLERMLMEAGKEPPPANHPPRTNRSYSETREHKEPRYVTMAFDVLATNAPVEPVSCRAESNLSSQDNESGDEIMPLESLPPPPAPPQQLLPTTESMQDSNSPKSSIGSKEKGIVDRILSTTGHLTYDSGSGRLRYFGPTTNFHVYADLGMAYNSAETREQDRRTDRIIRSLPQETYDYLMDLYWQYYNTVIHVVHREAFEHDKERGGVQNYSGFLNICLLAMGYRFADPSRPEIRKISVYERESELHREAKYLFEYELEKPGGIPSVQALLILGDLENCVGRDNTGWMYAGMACRLSFDLGLNLDTAEVGLSDQEVQIRHMVLWACVIYDKYWALFLGRPTCIKTSDLAMAQLTSQFASLGTSRVTMSTRTLETEIYNSLLDLMDLATRITERVDIRQNVSKSDASAHLAVAALDRDLNTWYRRLSPQLKWTPANIEKAPFSYFLLHQQFHTALIMLHRPFAQYQPYQQFAQSSEQNPEEASDSFEDHYSTLSRTICFDNAIRVARIFQTHRRRFDTRQIFCTGMQHAGTAATALIAGVTQIRDPQERTRPLQHLRTLGEALKMMSPAYQPAQRMSNVLEDVCQEAGWDLSQLPELDEETPTPRPTIPARRGTDDGGTSSVAKRRQIFALQDTINQAHENIFAPQSARKRAESFAMSHTNTNILSARLSTSSTLRPESIVWIDQAHKESDLFGGADNNGMNFLNEADNHANALDDLDAFADFDLPSLPPMDSKEGTPAATGTGSDLWRGYVWQVDGELTGR